MELLDQRLPPPKDQDAEQVLVAAKLAFACLNVTPKSRPTMQQVARKMSNPRPSLEKEFHLTTLGDLIKSNCITA